VIDYWLRRDAASPVSVEIRDGRGVLVRRFASDEGTPKLRADRYFADRWVRPGAPLPAKAGAHRLVWDLRTERPRCSRYEYSIAAVDGEDTPKVPEGMLVPPGVYQVTLVVGDKKYTVPLLVDPDPRVAVDLPSLEAAFALSRDLVTQLARHMDATAARPEGDSRPELDAVGGALTDLQIDLEASDRAPTEPQREAFADLTKRLDRALSATAGKPPK